MKRVFLSHRYRHGFTIVELLIVIVVIGILASITIVAYNGIQARSKIAKSLTDLSSVNKLIQIYYAENGTYPTTGGTWYWSNDQPTAYVPGVVPKYTPSLPVTSGSVDGSVQNNAYGYQSNGTDYKLMAHSDGLCEDVKKQRPAMVASTARLGPPCWAYGYWTPAAENW